MPGIVGLLTKMPREQAEQQLLRMVAALRHESFYTAGTWIDESLGVYVGWIARENSFSDGMPVQNEEGDTVLVFSGEEYPEPESMPRLKQRGHEFKLRGASYLVHVSEEDPTFPACLNGRFHGLLIHRTDGTATLFNDRYGMHRIYYCESKDAFYFAAEAKAILSVQPQLRRPDARSLGEAVALGCVLENRTVFEGIRLLPAGSVWDFRNGAVCRKNTYFSPKQWEEQAPLEKEAYYLKLRNVFARNVARYFNGGEPIGVSLTGGLDTRMIMAWQQAPPASLRCYTFGGPYRVCEDVTLARRVAKVCGQPHEVITVDDEFLARFPYYAERSLYLSDACVDVSRTPDLFVSVKAREIAPVKVVGTYGSEIIRQARMFKPARPPSGLYHRDFSSWVDLAEVTYNGLLREHPVTFAAFRQSPWHHFGILALEQSQLTVRSPYLDNEFVRTVFRAPRQVATDSDVRLQLIADGNPALRQIRTDRGLNGSSRSLFSLANRGVLEFLFKAEYAYDYGMPQWVARVDHLLSPLHLERLFLGRHKFYHFRVWYRDALSRYVREMLLDPRTLSRPFLNPKRVKEVVNGHVRRGLNYTSEIHKLLSLELMHRLFFDN